MIDMTVSYEEKRRFSRILYQANAELSRGHENWPCTLIDLSLKGCLLELPADWQGTDSESYHLHLALSEECQIEMPLQLTFQLDNHAGFYCNEIDLNSITQLRRLVELNLGDNQLLERELDALAHCETT